VPVSMRAGYVLITRELRRLARDPAALLTIVVAPFLLAVITSVSLGARPKIEAGIGVAGPKALVAAMIAGQRSVVPGLRLSTVAITEVSADNAAAALTDGKIAAAIIVPEDAHRPVRVLGAKSAPIAREVATSIARSVVVARSAPPRPLSVTTVPPGRKPLVGAEIYGPVIAVFFVLFGVGSVSRSLQTERVDGTLGRLLTSPIRPSLVLASKGVMMFLVGVVEVLVVVAATTVLFGASWGNSGGVALVTVVLVGFGIALATAIASFTSSSTQALGLETAVALALIALGGHMVPLRNLPSFATVVSHYTPNGAAIDAFENIASGEGSLASQLAPLVVTIGFVVAVGAVGLTRLRKVLSV
jgi:ABC-2 type transport system permease protein